MPLYEYRCRDCDERFETLQAVGQSAEGLHCPDCDSTELEKLLSTFATAASSASGASASEGFAGCGRPECAGGRCAG